MTEEVLEEFDLDAKFEEQVAPLLQQLQEKCEELGVPLLVAACTSFNGENFNVFGVTAGPQERASDELVAAASYLFADSES